MVNKRWCGTQHVEKISSDLDVVNVSRLKNESYPDQFDTESKDEYIIVSLENIKKLFANVKCPTCEHKCLLLSSNGKIGFSTNLKLSCDNCHENVSSVTTSESCCESNSPDINLRITQAFSHIGKGYSAIEKFCMIMNIAPFSSATFAKCLKKLNDAQSIATQNILSHIHKEVKKAQVSPNTVNNLCDIAVSFDGTWLTRGHSSLIGVSCVIDIVTGYVVDFEVMSKVCRLCDATKNNLGEQSADFFFLV